VKRSEMVCNGCSNFHPPAQCRFNPKVEVIHAPDRHWCAQGVWRGWCEKWKDYERVYWGDWDETD
jgi:hypothetical protein